MGEPEWLRKRLLRGGARVWFDWDHGELPQALERLVPEEGEFTFIFGCARCEVVCAKGCEGRASIFIRSLLESRFVGRGK